MFNIRFQFWPYTKLMIILWLIVPDFERASYAYNNIIRKCISSNPQAAIRSLNNWRKFFVKKDDFLLHAERYVEENGTEALTKLIASKVNIYIVPIKDVFCSQLKNWANSAFLLLKSTTYKPVTEATNASRVTDHEEMQKVKFLCCWCSYENNVILVTSSCMSHFNQSKSPCESFYWNSILCRQMRKSSKQNAKPPKIWRWSKKKKFLQAIK